MVVCAAWASTMEKEILFVTIMRHYRYVIEIESEEHGLFIEKLLLGMIFIV